jgi:hypothetical protein
VNATLHLDLIETRGRRAPGAGIPSLQSAILGGRVGRLRCGQRSGEQASDQPRGRPAAPSSGPALRYQSCRWSPHENLFCLVLVGITEASEAPLTVAPLMQGSDEGCEIWQVPGWDLGCGGQML